MDSKLTHLPLIPDLVHGDQPVRADRVRAGHGLPRVRPHRLPGRPRGRRKRRRRQPRQPAGAPAGHRARILVWSASIAESSNDESAATTVTLVVTLPSYFFLLFRPERLKETWSSQGRSPQFSCRLTDRQPQPPKSICVRRYIPISSCKIMIKASAKLSKILDFYF